MVNNALKRVINWWVQDAIVNNTLKYIRFLQGVGMGVGW